MMVCCIYQAMLDRLRRGKNIRLAVPVYIDGEWSYDSKVLGENPDVAFDNAMRTLEKHLS